MPMPGRFTTALFQLPQSAKKLILLSIDFILIIFAIWLAYVLKYTLLQPVSNATLLSFLIVPVLSIPVFVRLGLYRAVMRYVGQKAMGQIFKGVVFSIIILYLIGLFTSDPYISKSHVAIYGLLAFVLIGGVRFFARMLTGMFGTSRRGVAVAIYGAGSAGRQLVKMLNSGHEYRPVAFLDDGNALQGREVDGLEVLAPDDDAITSRLESVGVKEILLAVPSVQRSIRKKILRKLEPLPFHVRSVPGIEEMITGARIDQLQEIRIEDLLGRDPVPPDISLMSKHVANKTVLVTGAGGSIGSELCRQIILYKPRRLILVEQNEYSLYQIEKELGRLMNGDLSTVEIIPVLMDVCVKNEVDYLFTIYEIDTIYHAAAYKHVPMVEHNLVAGVNNNVMGTYFVADAAIKNNVGIFLLISTDKAVRPTNVMGASKRFAELVLQSMTQQYTGTIFSMVRFGNVLGSSGSVVPLFREQIKHTGPVTVTHPEITRFFMTIPEAAQLVIQASAMSKGGDVFVLDMGEPVKIIDLARSMINLAGLEVLDDNNPNGDIEIKYVGLRPGEKLYEELLIGENVSGTTHPKIMRAEEVSIHYEDMRKYLSELQEAIGSHNHEQILSVFKKTVNGFAPKNDIVDYGYQHYKKAREKDLSDLKLH